MQRNPDIILQLQIENEELKMKNELLLDKLFGRINEILDLNMSLKIVNDRMTSYIKTHEHARITTGNMDFSVIEKAIADRDKSGSIANTQSFKNNNSDEDDELVI